MDTRKAVHIFGGGTFSPVRNHLALAAPAFGETARQIAILCQETQGGKLRVEMHLTKMADPRSSTLVTNEDVRKVLDEVVGLNTTKIIFMNAAIVDFDGEVIKSGEQWLRDADEIPEPGSHSERLSSSMGHLLVLKPAVKLLRSIRRARKDIFLVAFKTTTGATSDEQYIEGLRLLKEASCNLVLANDVVTRNNMIITPEEARYHESTDRNYVLRNLVEMAYLRSHLTFTRSTVVDGQPVPWNSPEVFTSLRAVVDALIGDGAYKPFRGATVGHFACKLDANTFLTSRRKTNFNELNKLGLVRVKTDGPDSVIAYGHKPSVGGQSQRRIFEDHPSFDCVAHAHVPLRPDHPDDIPVVSQREYECGSHQCGENTSRGLAYFSATTGHRVSVGYPGDVFAAVMLDNHGPNVVFSHDIDSRVIVDFFRRNFDLAGKTGGFVELPIPKVSSTTSAE